MKKYTERERAVFNKLRQDYKGKEIQPSYLRVDVELDNNKSKYTFDIKKLGTETSVEVKLDRNDLFVATGIGLFLTAEVAAAIGAQPLQTYPNNTVFPAVVGPPAFTPGHLEVIYNGKFNMKQGTKVWIENLSNQVFRHVPQTQQSAAGNFSQYNLEDVTYKPGQLIYLPGNAQNDIWIEIPSFANIAIASQTAGTDHKVVFFPVGYLVKGASRN